jgi:hypothetical protein
MSNNRVPWWEQIPHPPTPVRSNETVIAGWSEFSLAKLSLQNKTPIYHKSFGGFINPQDMALIIAAIEATGAQLVARTDNKEDHGEGEEPHSYQDITWVWNDGIIRVVCEGANSCLSVSASCLDKQKLDDLEITIRKHSSSSRAMCEAYKGSVFMLGTSMEGLRLFRVGIGAIPIVKENYDAGVMDQYDDMVKDLSSQTPVGRLYLLSGPPGTGKTYFIRGLLHDVRALFVFIPAGMAESLVEPSFVPALLSIREQEGDHPIVIILEDADRCLVPRQADNLSAISTMLNMTSGITGDLVDLRFIATTNFNKASVDKALQRAGRLAAEIEIVALPAQQANIVYERLTGKTDAPFNKTATLCEVYALARANGWDPSAGAEPQGDYAARMTARLLKTNHATPIGYNR